MRRNAAPSFAALATVLVTMLVVGVFIPAVEVTNSAANTVRGRLIVDVYMRSSATTSDDARVRRGGGQRRTGAVRLEAEEGRPHELAPTGRVQALGVHISSRAGSTTTAGPSTANAQPRSSASASGLVRRAGTPKASATAWKSG